MLDDQVLMFLLLINYGSKIFIISMSTLLGIGAARANMVEKTQSKIKLVMQEISYKRHTYVYGEKYN